MIPPALAVGAALMLLFMIGCTTFEPAAKMPANFVIERGQLVFYTNVPLDSEHRLLVELDQQRHDLAAKLALEIPAHPIRVYLFESPHRYQEFMQSHYPDLPQRRAYFIQTQERLVVYSQWTDIVAEDLRHEVAHGYLHAAIPRIPIWIDEGLAEYFEVPPGAGGLNAPHVRLLMAEMAAGRWLPHLARLERLQTLHQMSQLDYAESWAWVHWMLETEPARLAVMVEHLQALRDDPRPLSMSTRLANIEPATEGSLVEHLKRLAVAVRGGAGEQ